MSKFYSGVINLSKIPANLIRKNRKGEDIIYADFIERRQPSQYGDTHYIKIYDAANKTSYYIGDFRESDFQQKSSEPSDADTGDMPIL